MWDFNVRTLPSGSVVSYLDLDEGTAHYCVHCFNGVHECRFEG